MGFVCSAGVGWRWSLWSWASGIFVGAVGYSLLEFGLERLAVRRRRLLTRQQDVCALLDLVAGQLAKDFPGAEPSVNVMIPMSGSALEVYACTTDMYRSGRAGHIFRKGTGCVGKLWESGQDSACAIFGSASEQREYGLGDDEIGLFEDIRCIVSMAIREGLGEEQRLLGFLNVHSAAEEAVEAWTVEPALQAFLLQVIDQRLARELSVG
jgi:hypothetical protein